MPPPQVAPRRAGLSLLSGANRFAKRPGCPARHRRSVTCAVLDVPAPKAGAAGNRRPKPNQGGRCQTEARRSASRRRNSPARAARASRGAPVASGSVVASTAWHGEPVEVRFYAKRRVGRFSRRLTVSSGRSRLYEQRFLSVGTDERDGTLVSACGVRAARNRCGHIDRRGSARSNDRLSPLALRGATHVHATLIRAQSLWTDLSGAVLGGRYIEAPARSVHPVNARRTPRAVGPARAQAAGCRPAGGACRKSVTLRQSRC